MLFNKTFKIKMTFKTLIFFSFSTWQIVSLLMFSLPQSLEPKCFDDLRPKIVPEVVLCPPLKEKKILVRVKWKEIKSFHCRKDSMPVSRRDRGNTNALNPSTTKP